MHYQLTEAKETTLLFIHGFCEDSRMWQYFLRGWKEDYQLLRVDLPGFGKSELNGETSLAEMARSVEKILRQEKIDKVIIIGHSMGGYVSLAFAELFPGYLRGLCLFHSHPFADSEENKKLRTRSAELVERGGQKVYVRGLFQKIFPEDFGNKKLVEKMIDRASAYPAAGIANGQRAMRDRPDRSKVLRDANFPVQFIIGTEDSAVPLEQSLQMSHLPATADIQILAGIGHMGMFENGGLTRKILREFTEFCESFAG